MLDLFGRDGSWIGGLRHGGTGILAFAKPDWAGGGGWGGFYPILLCRATSGGIQIC